MSREGLLTHSSQCTLSRYGRICCDTVIDTTARLLSASASLNIPTSST